ncbi:bifunctional aspartate kinase/homoserine dehydrogenase I [Spirochaetales bacterium NM-380-WT-3C1]|uniref:Bifunctional aspartate kinase/homoserine dehydrogenase I n=1 Tax=Bullifex porci TaxID=2606638 RepID=A0A7X2PD65_9SPIO|nr:bifunctional aspartate kinase/homoserine dehydrogenase I [Bullifex porci]MSU06673.1 bifunctional aspartate kinase/homoserine dehydrogenase I [Bullifex porci]
MDDLRVHALEGVMLCIPEGYEKLLKIHSSSTEESQVYVISPVHEGPLCLSGLLESAKKKDEILWSSLEQSQLAWLDLSSKLNIRDEIVSSLIRKGFEDMEDILRSVWLLEDISESTLKYFASLTSYYLALIASAYFNSNGITASLIAADKAVRQKSFTRGATFIYGDLIQPKIKVLSHEGESEYTACLCAVNAGGALTFWNNRSLLCTARKKDIPSAKVIERLSFAEATELSFFGAPIVHPHYFIPAQSQGIPIELKFWGDITSKGTIITDKKSVQDRRFPIKAFSVMRDISIINIEGAGMSGIPGISSRLFTALRREGISVILISQASSEYSICFAVPSSQVTMAAACARYEFESELNNHQIGSISAVSNMAILAAVGDVMSGQIGVSGKFFSALAKAGVNISAIAQGSSERNISAVIRECDSLKALSQVHASFFLSAQTMSVGVFGPGNIGGTFLNQIASEKERLQDQFGLDIRIRAIASSSRMLLSEEGIDLSKWRELFEVASQEYDLNKFLAHVGSEYYPHSVLVDCTTSNELASMYSRFLEKFHVITPNKKAATGSYSYYKEMFETCKRTGKRFLYETTVGAGLPVINTLNDLIQTGDEVKKIEGMLSGTLSWLFNRYDGTVPFSQLVLQAKEMGYTEPDPRDDLSGMDVARKTVILAREIGLDVELENLNITSLVPDKLKDASKEEFLSRLSEMDDEIYTKYKEAKDRGEVIRYVGRVDNGKCSVSLESFGANHPFASASGTDNVITFVTSRYVESQPLVIKGPGAGREVTAGGVFADLLRLAIYIGAGIL